MKKIWSIILAAGESRRMGLPKMLLEVNGLTMIENVIGNVAESETDGILVVLGSNSEKLVGIVSKYAVNYCININYSEGMLSSVQCGFRNLPLDTGAVMVFQGDQPFIASSTINLVIDAYRTSGKGVIIPLFNGSRGHPLLLSSCYRDEIETLDPGEGLRSITRIHADDIFEIETGDPGILRDIDTYEDYRRVFNQTR